jgi:formate hydrogenlyase subunit 4
MRIALINIVLILLFPLLLQGVTRRVKSIWSSRKGPSIIQPFYDIVRLLKKGVISNKMTSPLYQLAPAFALSTLLAAALLVPMVGKQAILSFNGDFILFCYLLALSKFFLVIGGMEAGNSFENMGCSRELTFSVLSEPGLFLIMMGLSLTADVKSFTEISNMIYRFGNGGWLLLILAVIGLLLFLLVDCGRTPIDDTETHLELTMIHEVIILDNSGPDLAMLNYAAALKMFLIISLVTMLIIPPDVGTAASFLYFTSIVMSMALLIGCIESSVTRLRMTHIPQFAFMIIALGMIIIFIILTQNGKPL